MTDKILDIWAIQNNPEELYTALKNIKTDVVIFKNVICKFKVGSKTVKMQYDSLIYSEESDTIILLMRGGEAKIEDAEKYFEDNNIEYDIVNFMDLSEDYAPTKTKEFWFARESYVVEDAVKDSITKGNLSCYYNPDIMGHIYFDYYYGKNNKQGNLISIPLKGYIEFEDKFILPTHSRKQKNIYVDDIINILKHNRIKYKYVKTESLNI